MIEKSKVYAIAEPLAQAENLFIVNITVSSANDIEITVDAQMRRLMIDDCIKLSKAIEEQLDRDTEDFSLSVFSAGIGYPITDYRQFDKVIGKTVEITFRSGQKFAAKLTAANINPDMTGTFDIEYQVKETPEGKKRKELVTKNETINMADIKHMAEQLDIK